MNVTYCVNEWDGGVVDYYTGQCRYCGQSHRYYPQVNEDDSPNREFEEGFFDCENHWNPSAECDGWNNEGTVMNTKQDCNFNIDYKGELWHLFECWLDKDREPQYYVGETNRGGIRVERTFYASEIERWSKVQQAK